MVRLIELIDRDAGGQEGGFRYLIGRFLSALHREQTKQISPPYGLSSRMYLEASVNDSILMTALLISDVTYTMLVCQTRRQRFSFLR